MSVKFQEIDGQLLAFDETDNKQILDADNNPMTPVEYYRSIGEEPRFWSPREKSGFIASYGMERYKELLGAFKRLVDMSVEQKARYVSEHGQEAFKALIMESKRLKTQQKSR